jgi:hypothetical protein
MAANVQAALGLGQSSASTPITSAPGVQATQDLQTGLVITGLTPKPINCDNEVLSTLQTFTGTLLDKIDSSIKLLVPTINNTLLSTGETLIPVKPVKALRAKSLKAPMGGSQRGGRLTKLGKGTPKQLTGAERISQSQQKMTEKSNNIIADVDRLHKAIQAVSSHLPCKPCKQCQRCDSSGPRETSGPTEGGSRVKKSIKTRRNRRS